MRKLISIVVLSVFIVSSITPPQGFAQTLTAVGLMSPPGSQVGLSAAFTPAHLKGMVIAPNDPFKFDFIIYRGDEPLTPDQKQAEYPKLIKYFLAALAIPDTDQWVNLSPYEKDRIIPDDFSLTEMGRDLLAQDYLLKQLAASLTNPAGDLGKKFWDSIYETAYQKFGTTDVPTDTISKVWIVPDRAVIFEKGSAVYVLENHLKVMTEKDYLAMKNISSELSADEKNASADISAQVMREVIIPAIEKEVNEGKNFAPLRQVYSGMLLATWYKRALKESILGKLYADQAKVKGVDQDPKNNQKIYDQYVVAFKKGVFNIIKEDVDRLSQEVIPRKYFSGGTVSVGMAINKDPAMLHKADLAQASSDFAKKENELDAVRTVLRTSATGQAMKDMPGPNFAARLEAELAKGDRAVPILLNYPGQTGDVASTERLSELINQFARNPKLVVPSTDESGNPRVVVTFNDFRKRDGITPTVYILQKDLGDFAMTGDRAMNVGQWGVQSLNGERQGLTIDTFMPSNGANTDEVADFHVFQKNLPALMEAADKTPAVLESTIRSVMSQGGENLVRVGGIEMWFQDRSSAYYYLRLLQAGLKNAKTEAQKKAFIDYITDHQATPRGPTLAEQAGVILRANLKALPSETVELTGSALAKKIQEKEREYREVLQGKMTPAMLVLVRAFPMERPDGTTRIAAGIFDRAMSEAELRDLVTDLQQKIAQSGDSSYVRDLVQQLRKISENPTAGALRSFLSTHFLMTQLLLRKPQATESERQLVRQIVLHLEQARDRIDSAMTTAVAEGTITFKDWWNKKFTRAQRRDLTDNPTHLLAASWLKIDEDQRYGETAHTYAGITAVIGWLDQLSPYWSQVTNKSSSMPLGEFETKLNRATRLDPSAEIVLDLIKSGKEAFKENEPELRGAIDSFKIVLQDYVNTFEAATKRRLAEEYFGLNGDKTTSSIKFLQKALLNWGEEPLIYLAVDGTEGTLLGVSSKNGDFKDANGKPVTFERNRLPQILSYEVIKREGLSALGNANVIGDFGPPGGPSDILRGDIILKYKPLVEQALERIRERLPIAMLPSELRALLNNLLRPMLKPTIRRWLKDILTGKSAKRTEEIAALNALIDGGRVVPSLKGLVLATVEGRMTDLLRGRYPGADPGEYLAWQEFERRLSLVMTEKEKTEASATANDLLNICEFNRYIDKSAENAKKLQVSNILKRLSVEQTEQVKFYVDQTLQDRKDAFYAWLPEIINNSLAGRDAAMTGPVAGYLRQVRQSLTDLDKGDVGELLIVSGLGLLAGYGIARTAAGGGVEGAQIAKELYWMLASAAFLIIPGIALTFNSKSVAASKKVITILEGMSAKMQRIDRESVGSELQRARAALKNRDLSELKGALKAAWSRVYDAAMSGDERESILAMLEFSGDVTSITPEQVAGRMADIYQLERKNPLVNATLLNVSRQMLAHLSEGLQDDTSQGQKAKMARLKSRVYTLYTAMKSRFPKLNGARPDPAMTGLSRKAIEVTKIGVSTVTRLPIYSIGIGLAATTATISGWLALKAYQAWNQPDTDMFKLGVGLTVSAAFFFSSVLIGGVTVQRAYLFAQRSRNRLKALAAMDSDAAMRPFDFPIFEAFVLATELGEVRQKLNRYSEPAVSYVTAQMSLNLLYDEDKPLFEKFLERVAAYSKGQAQRAAFADDPVVEQRLQSFGVLYQGSGEVPYAIKAMVEAVLEYQTGGKVDNAATSDQNGALRGGIDFAQSNLDLLIRRDGNGVPLPVSQQNLDNIRIDGLIPVILEIKPAASMPLFSELATGAPSPA